MKNEKILKIMSWYEGNKIKWLLENYFLKKWEVLYESFGCVMIILYDWDLDEVTELENMYSDLVK